MKLNEIKNEVRVSSKKESQFTVVANAQAFEILSGSLYQFKVAAIVRELVSNAYDSHVEAGKKNVPFKVTIPNKFNKVFEIEDYGVGLDDDEVRNVYTSLFTSTKTDTNDQIGAFGLGAKTPISYTSTFTIRARKNNIERLYTVYKNERGIPCINLLYEKETNESNGLKVSVPVYDHDIDRFKYEAEFILGFFSPEPIVELDGFKFKTKEAREKLENSNIAFINLDQHSNRSELYRSSLYIVMGNVCYNYSKFNSYNPFSSWDYNTSDSEYDSDLSDTLINYSREDLNKVNIFVNTQMVKGNAVCYIKFDIGELEVAASRETLSSNDQQIKKVELKLFELFLNEFRQHQEIVDNLPNKLEAVKYVLKNRLNYIETYKNQPINPGNIQILKNQKLRLYYKQNSYFRSNTIDYTHKLSLGSLFQFDDDKLKKLKVLYSSHSKPKSGFVKFTKELINDRQTKVLWIYNVNKESVVRYLDKVLGVKVDEYIDFDTYLEDLKSKRKAARKVNGSSKSRKKKLKDNIINARSLIIENDYKIYVAPCKNINIDKFDFVFHHSNVDELRNNIYNKIYQNYILKIFPEFENKSILILQSNSRNLKKIEKNKIKTLYNKNNSEVVFNYFYDIIRPDEGYWDIDFNLMGMVDFKNVFGKILDIELVRDMLIENIDENEYTKDEICDIIKQSIIRKNNLINRNNMFKVLLCFNENYSQAVNKHNQLKVKEIENKDTIKVIINKNVKSVIEYIKENFFLSEFLTSYDWHRIIENETFINKIFSMVFDKEFNNGN